MPKHAPPHARTPLGRQGHHAGETQSLREPPQVYLHDLPLSAVARKYLAAIVGPNRFDPASQRVHLVVRQFPTMAENKRHGVELLHHAVLDAQTLAQTYGDFVPEHAPTFGFRAKRRDKARKGNKPLSF